MAGPQFHGVAALACVLFFCHQSAVGQDRSARLPPEEQSSSHGGAPVTLPPSSTTLVAKTVTADVVVTDDMLKNAARDENNWLLHGRTYDNQRYSPLKQINPSNIKRLVPVSIIQTGVANSFEATPLVVNGVMYVSTPGDHVLALDAVTGDPLWSYTPSLRYSDLCCGPQSRGVAVAYGKVFHVKVCAIVQSVLPNATGSGRIQKQGWGLRRHLAGVATGCQQATHTGSVLI